MPNHSLKSLPLALIALLAAPTVSAKDADQPRPPAYQDLVACQAITDSAARLSCYDKAVQALASATERKDVLIVDRATIRETKRGLFGISLPKLNIFGPGDNEEVNQIESRIKGVTSSRDGLSVFILDDGSRWKQTEGRYTFAKAGSQIIIKRGALGGFMANVDKQPAVRVMRLPEP